MDWSRIDNSPAALQAFLESEGLAPKKRWGQNFMISPGARAVIVRTLGVRDGDLVWEIGPGLGAITAMLVEAARQVVVFEIDHGAMRVLRDRFGERIKVVAGDAVKTLAQAAIGSGAHLPDVVAGNLPYRSAAAIIAVLLENRDVAGSCRNMVFTVQREMALRMTAGVGQKDYSPFSVLCSLAARVTLESDLAGGSFYPVPEVVSSVVSVVPSPEDRTLLSIASVCARSLFTSRRKTIRNNLPTLASGSGLPVPQLTEMLEQVGVDSGLRAEALPPAVFLSMASAIREKPGSRFGRPGTTPGESSSQSHL